MLQWFVLHLLYMAWTWQSQFSKVRILLVVQLTFSICIDLVLAFTYGANCAYTSATYSYLKYYYNMRTMCTDRPNFYWLYCEPHLINGLEKTYLWFDHPKFHTSKYSWYQRYGLCRCMNAMKPRLPAVAPFTGMLKCNH